jgi:hypothetical protein
MIPRYNRKHTSSSIWNIATTACSRSLKKQFVDNTGRKSIQYHDVHRVSAYSDSQLKIFTIFYTTAHHVIVLRQLGVKIIVISHDKCSADTVYRLIQLKQRD